jgi:DNA polymerase-3 subunit alpha
MGKRSYDLEACEELLKDTYGITVSRTGDAFIPKLADFSKGDADVKRWEEAKDVLDKMNLNLSQAAAKGHPGSWNMERLGSLC